MGVQPLINALRAEPELRIRPLVWRVLHIAERVVAAGSLLLMLPFLVAIAFLIAALSRQSPLIAHRRVGRHGLTIWVVKLRTMWDRRLLRADRITLIERLTSECDGAIVVKNRKDPRVTSRFAGFCRRYSIDEIPQLWHVLRGEMALVGPRPLTSRELELHYGPVINELLNFRPGITGLWQVSGRSRLSYVQRRQLDLFLIRNWSPHLYLKILFRTIPAVLTGKNSW